MVNQFGSVSKEEASAGKAEEISKEICIWVERRLFCRLLTGILAPQQCPPLESLRDFPVEVQSFYKHLKITHHGPGTILGSGIRQ